MKHLNLTLLLFFSLSSLIYSQTAELDLKTMVETERAFAKTSLEKGTAPAFLAFIADDGILFRPKAVKGKQWLKDNPPPASDKRPLLKWEPLFGFMASSGDMGYTFGPWEFRRDIKDKEAAAFGHFLTVWKKQADGSWKFAIDLGISHSKPDTTKPRTISASNPPTTNNTKTVDVKAETARLLMRDKDFSQSSSNAAKAFEKTATDDVRLFREGKFPISGRELALAAITPNLWTWTPEGGDVSASGDFGYTYGSYEIREGAKLVETGNYLRIWRKESGDWKIAVDLSNPVVDRKN